MKSINDQLYGFSYELNHTTEEDLTTCFAIDTGTVFVAYGGVWYEQPTRWAEQSGSGGGGGGGGSSDVLVVNIDENDTLDKTWQEIHDAMPLAVLCSNNSAEGVNSYFVRGVYVNGVNYVVATNDDNYIATSSDGFPVLDGGQ